MYYSTEELDLLTEVYKDGADVYSYFFTPIPGKLELPLAGTRWDVDDQPDPLLVSTGKILSFLFLVILSLHLSFICRQSDTSCRKSVD